MNPDPIVLFSPLTLDPVQVSISSGEAKLEGLNVAQGALPNLKETTTLHQQPQAQEAVAKQALVDRSPQTERPPTPESILEDFSEDELDEIEELGRQSENDLYKMAKPYRDSAAPEAIAQAYTQSMRESLKDSLSDEKVRMALGAVADRMKEYENLRDQFSITEIQPGLFEITSPVGGKKTVQVKGKEAANKMVDDILLDHVATNLPPGVREQVMQASKKKNGSPIGAEDIRRWTMARPGARAAAKMAGPAVARGIGQVEGGAPFSMTPAMASVAQGLPAGIDTTMGLACVMHLDTIRKGIQLGEQADKLKRDAELLRSEGKEVEAKILERRAEKLNRQSLGMIVKGSSGFSGSICTTAAGVAGFVSLGVPTAAAVATNLTVVGAAFGIVSGGITLGLSMRNIVKASIKKNELNDLMNTFVSRIGSYPGTEAEVQLGIELIYREIRKQEIKITSNSMGAAAAACTIGASCFVIAAALSAETYGAGAVVFAAAAVGVAVARVGYLGYQKWDFHQYQKMLKETGHLTETEEGKFVALYFQCKSEQLMKQSPEYQKRNQQTGEFPAYFSDIICPKLYGFNGEAFVRMVEGVMETQTDLMLAERPEIMATVEARQEAQIPGMVNQAALPYSTDPVWSERAHRHVMGEVSSLYRGGNPKMYVDIEESLRKKCIKREQKYQRALKEEKELQESLSQKAQLTEKEKKQLEAKQNKVGKMAEKLHLAEEKLTQSQQLHLRQSIEKREVYLKKRLKELTESHEQKLRDYHRAKGELDRYEMAHPIAPGAKGPKTFLIRTSMKGLKRDAEFKERRLLQAKQKLDAFHNEYTWVTQEQKPEQVAAKLREADAKMGEQRRAYMQQLPVQERGQYLRGYLRELESRYERRQASWSKAKKELEEYRIKYPNRNTLGLEWDLDYKERMMVHAENRINKLKEDYPQLKQKEIGQ
ncbi:MAG: hypothetical protein KDK65_00755 [Chlamydiia bacterium]|nr:hypothetical protein [Chlamydiia bacterium]